jgi:hypothetical protein
MKKEKKIMTTSTTVFVRGKIYWPKIVGDGALRSNYEGTAREWSYEFVPEDTTFLKDHGLLDRLKAKPDPKNPDKGEFLVLRKPELNFEGEKNDPIRIYTEENEPWDDRLLGNGTEVDAKLSIKDWGKGKKKSIYTTAIRVRELVPYQGSEFARMDSDDAAPSKAATPAKKPKTKVASDYEDLDDDIPF